MQQCILIVKFIYYLYLHLTMAKKKIFKEDVFDLEGKRRKISSEDLNLPPTIRIPKGVEIKVKDIEKVLKKGMKKKNR